MGGVGGGGGSREKERTKKKDEEKRRSVLTGKKVCVFFSGEFLFGLTCFFFFCFCWQM